MNALNLSDAQGCFHEFRQVVWPSSQKVRKSFFGCL